jgi:polysaccharide biosynthesis protein PslJ
MSDTQTASVPERGATLDVGSSLIAASFLAVAAAVLLDSGRAAEATGLVLAATAALVVGHRVILAWRGLVVVVLAVLLYIPAGRVSLPINLPFDMAPYRLAVAFVLLGWGLSLLADPSVRLRRSPFDIAIGILCLAVIGSVLANPARVQLLESAVLKSLSVFFSYILFYYFILSTIRSLDSILFLTKVFVSSTTVVAFFSAIEQRTHFNIFDHVTTVLPLQFTPDVQSGVREGAWRAIASAEHPIALGVLFVMAIPLAFALAQTASRWWWISCLLLSIGVLSTASRTPIAALIAAAILLASLRPREVLPIIPMLVPVSLVIAVAVPGSFHSVKESFFPEGGLIKQASTLSYEADPTLAGGRIRQIGPMLHEGSRTPLFGQGLGTRQTGFNNPLRNAPILDNQWLTNFLDIGLVGVVGWALLIGSSVRRLTRLSRSQSGTDGWLAVGYSASIVGFAVGMFTYDSMSFTQEAFVFWILLGLSSSLLLTRDPRLRLVAGKSADQGSASPVTN